MAAEITQLDTPASLYVGDLPLDVTDGVLFDAFSQFKSITSVRVCRDSSTGTSLGYGYVNFALPQDAIQALGVKNHSNINGKVIRVMWSHRDSNTRSSGIANVFVKNLSDSIDSAKLQEMFQKFGTILSCKVASSNDGRSKGHGFVQFDSESSAEAAIKNLNGLTDGGKELYVGKFMKKSDRVVHSHEAKYTNLYIKNLEIGLAEEFLKEKFSQYGKIVSFVISKDENGASRGFGFVNYENADDAKHAVEALHGSQLGSKILYVARAQKRSERGEVLRRQFEEKKMEQINKFQNSNVYVKNIDDDITEDELREHFSKCGAITSVKIMRDDKGISKGFGFIRYTTIMEANRAVYTFQGFMLHRKPLYTALAQRKAERRARLQVTYAQRMAGLGLGPHPFSTGVYSPLYYPVHGAVSQIPSQPGLIYQPSGFRPGWRANVPINSRQYRPNRGRVNGYAFPQSSGFTCATSSHRTAQSMVSVNSNNQQLGKYDANGRPYGTKKLSTSAHPILIAAGHETEGSSMLSSLLAAAPPDQQKQILQERLYPLVYRHQPDLAAKITGKLLEMDNSEILVLFDSSKLLESKVVEAAELLKLSKSQVPNQDPLHSNYLSSGVVVK